MNSSSQTTGSNSTSQVDYLYNRLMVASHVFVYYSVAVHFFYIVLMIIMPDLHKRPLVFINHSVIVSTIYPTGILIFQFVNPAQITDQKLVHVLCSFFEYLWPVSVSSFTFLIICGNFNRNKRTKTGSYNFKKWAYFIDFYTNFI